MGTNIENGQSVYCREPIEKREIQPLYSAVRELVHKHSQTRTVMDIGCSDLPASRILNISGFQVIGVDLDKSCLRKAKSRGDKSDLVQADARHLPFNNTKADAVILLDILEHLERYEAIELLTRIPEFTADNPKVIVSMPIINLFSIPCQREFLLMTRQMKRPLIGLFDRTHKIFTGRKGHKQLFKDAGLIPEEEYYTFWKLGLSGYWELNVSGDWKTLNKQNLPKRSNKYRAYELATHNLIPRVLHPLNESKRQSTTDNLIAYQGLYVLKTTT